MARVDSGRPGICLRAVVGGMGHSWAMGPSSLPLAFVVIAGPQASGKSTVARALSEELRDEGERVALVELDQIAGMALPTLPRWETAFDIFASVAGQWAHADLTAVIAEGAGTGAEVARLLDRAPEGAAVLTVVTTAPFEVALSRARADLTRGVSRERAFLREIYKRWSGEIGRIETDVLLDTQALKVTESVRCIRDRIAVARRTRGAPR